jgi:hypothetical protein
VNEKETNHPAHPMDRTANWCSHGGWFTLAGYALKHGNSETVHHEGWMVSRKQFSVQFEFP